MIPGVSMLMEVNIYQSRASAKQRSTHKTKGNRGNNDLSFISHPTPLDLILPCFAYVRVIRSRDDTIVTQPIRYIIGFFFAERIDYSCLACMIRPYETNHIFYYVLLRVRLAPHGINQVGSVGAGPEEFVLSQSQDLCTVVSNPLGSRRLCARKCTASERRNM